MKMPEPIWLFLAAYWLPLAALGGEPIYKSVDATGNVTYSEQPPANAAKVEDVQLPPGPSREEMQQSLERAKGVEQAADAHYDAMMERRRQEEEARKKAQEEADAAERQRRLDETIERLESQPSYYTWPQWRPYPPRPPHPPHPPRPPYPPHPSPR